MAIRKTFPQAHGEALNYGNSKTKDDNSTSNSGKPIASNTSSSGKNAKFKAVFKSSAKKTKKEDWL